MFQTQDILTNESLATETPMGLKFIYNPSVNCYNALSKATKKIPVVEHEVILEKIAQAVKEYDSLENFYQFHQNVFSLGNSVAANTWERLLGLLNTKTTLSPPGNAPLAKDYDLYLCNNKNQVINALEYVESNAEQVYLDTETTGLAAYKGSICLVQLGFVLDGTLIIFLMPSRFIQWEYLNQALIGTTVIVHNLKFDLNQLMAQGVNLHHPDITLVDTMLLYRSFYPGLLIGNSGLGDILAGQYPVKLDKRYQKLAFNRDIYGFEMIDYAACDIYALHVIHTNFKNYFRSVPHLEQVQKTFAKFYSIEMEVLKVVQKMEFKGIPLDMDKLNPLADEVTELVNGLTQKLKLTMELATGNPDPNPNSPMQVMAVMEILCKGKVTITSTAEDTIKDYLGNTSLPEDFREFVEQFMEYKKQTKLLSFLTKLPTEINPETGRVHASFNHSGTATGRFSCNNPNMQQIPRDGRMRELFAAPKGKKLIVADYSQIELVIAAQITKDKVMTDAYNQGLDIHKITGALVSGKELSEVTKADRQLAKAVNFGLIYGMGAKKFVIYAKTSYGVEVEFQQALDFKEKFLSKYQGIAEWHKLSSMEQNYYIIPPAMTLSGRLRLFRHPIVGGQSMGGFSFSAYVNSQDQGTGADMVKISLILLDQLLDNSRAYPILTVHDEIVLEADEDYVEEATKILESVMLHAAYLFIKDMPVNAEAGVGDNWLTAKP
jgi:DNA polymerase I-like protein with 3'-5' exonuclease and polymerase domains